MKTRFDGHTEGPWRLSVWDTDEDGMYQIHSKSGKYVDPVENLGNAELIKATPELLALVKEIAEGPPECNCAEEMDQQVYEELQWCAHMQTKARELLESE